MGRRFLVNLFVMVTALVLAAGCRLGPARTELEEDNPLRAAQPPPLGMEEFFANAPRTDPARVRLGRWLFFDRRLSVDNTVSCATCHRPAHAFSDTHRASPGVGGQRGRRKTPSILNLAARTVLVPAHDVGPAFFWDGRATSLEMQVVMPIRDPAEMGLDHQTMISRVSAISGYAPYFQEAFGSRTITLDAVASALAEYVRTRRSGNSPFDRWSYGRNPPAISPQARAGYDVFSFKGRCALCHSGYEFSDGQFHNLGVGWDPAADRFRDEGRREVTGAIADTGKFKTPRLRDVEKHPPYMHDGSLRTLREVVEFYNRGGTRNPWQSARLRGQLNLTSNEIDAIVEFLRALNGDGYQDNGPQRFPQ